MTAFGSYDAATQTPIQHPLRTNPAGAAAVWGRGWIGSKYSGLVRVCTPRICVQFKMISLPEISSHRNMASKVLITSLTRLRFLQHVAKVTPVFRRSKKRTLIRLRSASYVSSPHRWPLLARL